MIDRLHLAAHSPTAVVGAQGLLAVFNDAGVTDPLDTLSAATVARLHHEDDERVALAAALTVRGTRYGHVCIRLANLRAAIVVEGEDPQEIDSLPWPDPAEWEQAVAASVLVGDGSSDHPLVWTEGRLYLERYFRYEQQVARLITDRATAEARPLARATEEMLDRLLGPESEQRRAAFEALRGRVTVIAGGPGTGKTFTVGVMLEALAADPDGFPLVALCAPTGKAAARLGEALVQRAQEDGDEAIAGRLTGISPSTIHRLLGWSRERGRFARDATNRLPHDLVIVDEMSMVSLPLAAKLLQAVRDDATVVLVGDPYQLESIEAGTVLADIVGPRASGARGSGSVADRVIVLEEGHRFDAQERIGTFADAVRTGDEDKAIELLMASGGDLRWISDRSAPGFAELWEEIVSQRVRLVELSQAGGDPSNILKALTGVAILCAHKRGPDGVSRWSRDIEAMIDTRFPTLRWKSEWYPGRPVMITKNNYNLDLYNGDIGVAVKTDDGLKAVFERGEVRTFPLSHLTEHTTVHAMTIHKSQGSQFDQVVVLLPGEESRLLTRELLYTAVTRAQAKVWLVGPETVIRQAIRRSVQRASGLGSLLWS